LRGGNSKIQMDIVGDQTAHMKEAGCNMMEIFVQRETCKTTESWHTRNKIGGVKPTSWGGRNKTQENEYAKTVKEEDGGGKRRERLKRGRALSERSST